MYVAQKGAMNGNPFSKARRQLSAWQSRDVGAGIETLAGVMGGGVIVDVNMIVVV